VSLTCVVSLCAQPDRARHNPAASKNNRFIVLVFFLFECNLEGADEYLPLSILVAVCGHSEGAGHFPEQPA